MSIPVEVDQIRRALSSPHRFLSQSYNYFRFPSTILNLQVQEVSDTTGVDTTEKFANENRSNLVSSWHRT